MPKTLASLQYLPIVLVTRTLYWSMFESGLALIACCLPTLRFLFGPASMERLQRSLRSMLSLHSIDSGQSQPTEVSDGRYERYNGSNTSHAPFVKEGEGEPGIHTYAMQDIEASLDLPPPGQIHVKNSISHSDSRTVRDTFETMPGPHGPASTT